MNWIYKKISNVQINKKLTLFIMESGYFILEDEGPGLTTSLFLKSFPWCQCYNRRFPSNCKGSKVQLSIWLTLVTPSCRLPVSYIKIKNMTIQFSREQTHSHAARHRVPRPKPPALVSVSIAMSVSLSSSGLKGWPDFTMWLLYWAWSAFVAPSTAQSASVRFWPVAVSLAA